MFTVITESGVFRVSAKHLTAFKNAHTVMGVHKDGQTYARLW